MKKDKIKAKIETDPDFINHPRLRNSLTKLIEANPDGFDDEEIAKFLMCSKEEVEQLYNQAIQKLRVKMKVNVNID